MRWTFDRWNKELSDNKIQDISQNLEDGFLMIYQKMRALIVYEGKIYYASAWVPPEGEPFVELEERTINRVKLL